MSSYPMLFDGIMHKSSESAFQCSRLPPDHPAIPEIVAANSPFAAKLIAKKHSNDFIVKPTSQEDVDNMERCLRAKLDQNQQLIPMLIETGNATIIEDVTNRQKGFNLFWGAALQNGVWVGNNILGNLWMLLRSELT